MTDLEAPNNIIPDDSLHPTVRTPRFSHGPLDLGDCGRFCVV